jgi:hypothetical protein
MSLYRGCFSGCFFLFKFWRRCRFMFVHNFQTAARERNIKDNSRKSGIKGNKSLKVLYPGKEKKE